MKRDDINQDKIDNLNRQIMMYQSKGFNVVTKDEKTYTAIMEKEGVQKAWVHILLFLVSLGLLNIVYYFYAKGKKKQITVFG